MLCSWRVIFFKFVAIKMWKRQKKNHSTFQIKLGKLDGTAPGVGEQFLTTVSLTQFSRDVWPSGLIVLVSIVQWLCPGHPLTGHVSKWWTVNKVIKESVTPGLKEQKTTTKTPAKPREGTQRKWVRHKGLREFGSSAVPSLWHILSTTPLEWVAFRCLPPFTSQTCFAWLLILFLNPKIKIKIFNPPMLLRWP